MKVLISRKDLRDTTSGVPKMVLQKLQYFKQLGFDSYAIAETINEPMIEEFGGIPVKTFKWPFSGFFRRKFYNKQVERWVAKNKPELVLGHGDILHQDILYIHNCVHLAHELIEGKPLPQDHEVGQIHTSILTEGTYKILICNSQMMKNDLVKRFQLDANKAVVIYPEVNLAKFKVDDPTKVKKEWREKFGFSEDDFVIGLVTSGNFKKRNLGLLIEAFKEVSAVNPKIKLFIAGRNIDQKYRDQAPKTGVVFAPAIVDVKNYYYLLDLFILPAHIEEFGLSVLEAMFCNVPVITTKFVGASEIIQGKGREFIMQETNQKTLVEMILKLQDKKIAQEVSEINQKTSVTLNSDSQNDVFGEILKKFGINV
ncbi:MAG: glycosyltransferase family 4 protein [Bdellovibrionales bacterium]|nr:glycosyltransferase family 4 protein [Bdellovibrionales bacterium]